MLCKFFEVSIHRLIVQGKDFLFLFNVSKNVFHFLYNLYVVNELDLVLYWATL